MTRSGTLAAFIAGSVLTGCIGSPSRPSALAFIPGPEPTVYAGTVQDTVSGAGTVRAALVTTDGWSAGTWTMSFHGQRDLELFPSGSVSNGSWIATLSPCPGGENSSGNCSFPACYFSLDARFTASGLIGTYTSKTTELCPNRTGSVSLAKQ